MAASPILWRERRRGNGVFVKGNVASAGMSLLLARLRSRHARQLDAVAPSPAPLSAPQSAAPAQSIGHEQHQGTTQARPETRPRKRRVAREYRPQSTCPGGRRPQMRARAHRGPGSFLYIDSCASRSQGLWHMLPVGPFIGLVLSPSFRSSPRTAGLTPPCAIPTCIAPRERDPASQHVTCNGLRGRWSRRL
ncbi:hypothetical protein OH77DRAFT_20690 [Trametes cingulata]|nr:hypothetical protein OH77DRAFT_20690 [Trametes cingulata]